MAFDNDLWENTRTIMFKGVKYRFIAGTLCGLIMVAKDEDIQNQSYPIQTYIIPDKDDELYQP